MKTYISLGIAVVSTGFAIYTHFQNKRLRKLENIRNCETQSQQSGVEIKFTVTNSDEIVSKNITSGKLLNSVFGSTELLKGRVGSEIKSRLNNVLYNVNVHRIKERKPQINWLVSQKGLEFILWIANPEGLVEYEVLEGLKEGFKKNDVMTTL